MSGALACWECGAPATLLCDWRLDGDPLHRLQRVREGKPARGPESCDRPMCKAHAHNHVRLHCLVQTKQGRRGELHTIDYCREHHAIKTAGANP